VSKTIATSNAQGFTIDGQGVAVDSSGTVYATGRVPQNVSAGTGGPVVQEITPTNALIAGAGSNFPGCGLGQTQAGFTDLGGLAVDGTGNLFLAQAGNGPVVRIGGGTITCITGNNYFWASGVAPDGAGGAYFSVYSTWEVYHATAAGVVTVIAGTSSQLGCGSNSSSPTGTLLGNPYGLAVDAAGALYIADRRCDVVWKFIPSTRTLSVVAGTPNQSGYLGDGGPATQALLFQPTGVALDPDGNVYIADWGNDVIRLVRNSDHTITTIAGNGSAGHYDDPNHATSSTFSNPFSIAVGPGGNVYVGEDGNGNRDIRELTITARATMISPAPGSTLTSPSTIFTWTSVLNADQYRLTVGSRAGATDYFDDAGSNLTATTDTVPNIPCDGRSVYVQLFTKLDGYWLPAQNYTYAAPADCAAILNPPNGSILGVSQPFSWNAVPGATGYQLKVAYISPSGSVVRTSYSTAATSLTVYPLPCDAKPILVQLVTVLNGTAMPPGNYAYTACKMLSLSASPTSVPAQGGTIHLSLRIVGPPGGSITGGLTITGSSSACVYNPVTHTTICPPPVTVFSRNLGLSHGQVYAFPTPVKIPAVPSGFPLGVQYTFNASFTASGKVVDTATATVRQY
jgi:hypothetical protein